MIDLEVFLSLSIIRLQLDSLIKKAFVIVILLHGYFHEENYLCVLRLKINSIILVFGETHDV